jgi:putative Mn2+ efflux pump MntP
MQVFVMPFKKGSKNPNSRAARNQKKAEKRYSIIASFIFIALFITVSILAYAYRTSFDTALNDILRAIVFFGVGTILSISVGSAIYQLNKSKS